MRYFLVAFVLTVIAGFSFAGDWRAPIPSKSAIESCREMALNSAYYPIIVQVCEYQPELPQCPSSKNGGTCEESAFFKYKASSAGGVYTGTTSRVVYTYCPDSAPKWNGTQCVQQDPCASKGGQSVDDGSIGPDNVKLALSFPIREDGNYVGQTFCSGGCKAAVTKEVGSIGIGMSGRYHNTMTASFSGQSCDPPGVPVGPDTTPVKLVQKTSKEYDCLASGKGYGYVNGAVMCVGANTKAGTAQQTSEKKNADGTTTKTTVDKSMTCTGAGSCTTTTTTTTTVYNADGTTQSTKSDQTKETSEGGGAGANGSSFCKENPSSAICKSGSFAGDCEAGFTCEGDAVGCATARASWLKYCQSKWLKPGNPSSSTTTLTEKKILPQGGITPVSISENGQCPADKVLTIAGRTVTFSYSTFCQFLGMIRPVIIAAGWLVAAYIVFGLGQKSE